MTPEIIATSFNPWLVLLSYAIAAVGSFTALTAAGAAQRVRGGAKRFNIGMAGLALGGVAIWSMHFVGMVAWQLDLQIGYRWLETVVSLVAAVVVSTLVLGYVAAGPLTARRLLIAGPLAGIGVCGHALPRHVRDALRRPFRVELRDRRDLGGDRDGWRPRPHCGSR